VQTSLAHIQINVRPQNMPFYRDLMTFLGWQPIYDHPIVLGMSGQEGGSLWFESQAKEVENDYDGPGANHIAIGTESLADVDATAAYLRDHNVATLFETPRHRPEFSHEGRRNYYQVMFESPDRILFEVVYTGPTEA
jgi:catechol 2,3-dioxygenase-like lactoylglutathione lyase family enzyme